MRFDILIRGGEVYGADSSPCKASVGVVGGAVAALLPPDTDADASRTFDARGMIVAPGLVDSHMHDEYHDDGSTVQRALLRQGVTSACAGHCGMGPSFEVSRRGRPRNFIKLSYMVGNCALREETGHTDRYSAATPSELAAMCDSLRRSLECGAMGLSLGLEYQPGASYEEVRALASIAAEAGRIVTVHTRTDDDRCVDAVREAISLARECGCKVQISHLGSMTMFHTAECMDIIGSAAADGLDVGFDCYPYDAFCTHAGSAVFDDGFERRWRGKGPDHLEAVSGRYRGQRLTYEALADMRSNDPDALIVAHVMDADDVELCLAHPMCIVASDSIITAGGAHPRAAGTFPRALSILRRRGVSWETALAKMTSMPADRLGLKDVGRIRVGLPADIAVFDPEVLEDRATFSDPLTPPAGVELVIIDGVPVLEHGEIAEDAPRIPVLAAPAR